MLLLNVDFTQVSFPLKLICFGTCIPGTSSRDEVF